ncbi:MAG: ATP-binding protein [Bacillota bacterium]|nr:ATP-binding protein [Bacillota bacterium]
MSSSPDTIEMSLPFKPEYVSVARLAASGIANRIGFDVEVIEDIKVAISEVCSKLVGLGSKISENYTIAFTLRKDRLDIIFKCSDDSLKCLFNNSNDELSLSIITALMDDFELCTTDKDYLLSMSKTLKEKG